MIASTEETHIRHNADLQLPRILCLHGGGVNAAIFKLQCRVLIAQLKGKLRLCFVDAPYSSEAGPGILPTYAERGPFRRWLRWKPEHPQLDAETIIDDIDSCIQSAMINDSQAGATGEWVGLLGFSQGAKICGSLLLRQQVKAQRGITKGNTNFRFGILMAGRGPLISMDTDVLTSTMLADADELTTGVSGLLSHVPDHGKDHILHVPTLHVHGLQDPGLRMHRQLFEHFCRKDSRNLIQWDGNHRIPIKRNDVAGIVNKILEIARDTKTGMH